MIYEIQTQIVNKLSPIIKCQIYQGELYDIIKEVPSAFVDFIEKSTIEEEALAFVHFVEQKLIEEYQYNLTYNISIAHLLSSNQNKKDSKHAVEIITEIQTILGNAILTEHCYPAQIKQAKQSYDAMTEKGYLQILNINFQTETHFSKLYNQDIEFYQDDI